MIAIAPRSVAPGAAERPDHLSDLGHAAQRTQPRLAVQVKPHRRNTGSHPDAEQGGENSLPAPNSELDT